MKAPPTVAAKKKLSAIIEAEGAAVGTSKERSDDEPEEGEFCFITK